jgi:putative nucleotidyltransferase-like protein
MLPLPVHLVDRVGQLADSAPSARDLEYHGIELVAARRWRFAGRSVPDRLVARERSAAVSALASPSLLGRVRAAASGPLLLVKGPDAARYYPDPGMRNFGDLDLIAPDAATTQRQLLDAGFQEAGDPALYRGIHHLRPLFWPGLPLVIEVHHSPKWPKGLTAPPANQLIASATSHSSGPDGFLTLPAAHHALVLAAHAWAHEPLARLRDLLDVALVARGADRRELDSLARAWGIRRIWLTTRTAIDSVLADGPRPLSIAVFARHLEEARERTVLESHLERTFGSLWGLPAHQLLLAAKAAGADLLPGAEESWPEKLARTRAAVNNAFVPKSQHDKMLQRKEEDDGASTPDPASRVA